MDIQNTKGIYRIHLSFSLINNDISQIQDMLHQTRFKALKNPYNSDYGLFINIGKAELTSFRDVYSDGNSENIVIELEQLNISNINLQPNPGVSNEILFENITGKTSNDGSFTVIGPDFSYDFNINFQGAFE